MDVIFNYDASIMSDAMMVDLRILSVAKALGANGGVGLDFAGPADFTGVGDKN